MIKSNHQQNYNIIINICSKHKRRKFGQNSSMTYTYVWTKNSYISITDDETQI